MIARVHSPTPGTPGVDVCGEVLPAQPGEPACYTLGHHVDWDAATGECRAAIDGLVCFDGQTLEIKRQLVWPGDLTARDPPIQFNGTVLIRGTVRDGAKVTAREDVEIGGGVEGATVQSTGGSVRIKQGIAGRQRALVSAAQNVDVRYIEQATVYAAGTVQVRHGVVHARVCAGVAVLAESGKGAIFGGEVRAGRVIRAKSFGNDAGVATRLIVGHSWEALAQLQEVEMVLAQLRQDQAHYAALRSRFQRAAPDPARFSARERQALCLVTKCHLVISYRLECKLQEYQNLDASLAAVESGEIVCTESLNCGTWIKIGATQAQVNENLPGCRVQVSPAQGRLVAEVSRSRQVPLG